MNKITSETVDVAFIIVIFLEHLKLRHKFYRSKISAFLDLNVSFDLID